MTDVLVSIDDHNVDDEEDEDYVEEGEEEEDTEVRLTDKAVAAPSIHRQWL